MKMKKKMDRFFSKVSAEWLSGYENENENENENNNENEIEEE